MAAVIAHETHDDGRECTLYGTPTGPAWMHRVGSDALVSVGVTTQPYTETCHRPHEATASD